MDLGWLSFSLTVKDLDVSREFYEKLGFEVSGGDASQNWLILKNGQSVIGLFHGMFEQNILTFTPGLNPDGELDEFTDIREIAAGLESAGIEFDSNVAETASGPAHITLVDPDGNPVLIDQHM